MTFPTLVSLIALAFPPSSIQAQPAPKPVPAPSIEEVIARSLQTHPEILVAEAKLAGAKADLELAKFALSQRILKAKNRLDAALLAGESSKQELKIAELRYEAGSGPTPSLFTARANSLIAKAQLADAETEWKTYQPVEKTRTSDKWQVEWNYTPPVAISPAVPTQAERERYDLLIRPLNMKKGAKIDLVEAAKLLQGEPDFKSLSLRVPAWSSRAVLKSPPLIEMTGGEMSVGGWLLFIADEFNTQTDQLPSDKWGPYDWYVREYGLVFEKASNKPIGAPSLAEFLKTVRGAPAPKKG